MITQSTNKVTRFHHARILRDHQLHAGELWICGNKIVEVQAHADVHVDLKGLILAPGYIDLQINGAFGVDFSTHPHKVNEVAKKLPKYGVTSFLPTVISSPKKKYPEILSHLQPQKGGEHGSNILGIHLEGPFFNPLKCGAHRHENVVGFNHDNQIDSFYGSLEGVKLVTLAPELEGSLAAITYLTNKHIMVAAGHSMASYDEMLKGMAHGIVLVTHLYNAMSAFQHRAPGIVGAALTHPNLHYTIIADGIHVDPVAIRLAWQANPKGLILVTDAITLLGMSTEDKNNLGSMEIVVSEARAELKNTKILAGSVTGMDQAVRNLRLFTSCSIEKAIEAASLKPAQLLGLCNKGTLSVGSDADFIVLDESLHVQASCVAGQFVAQVKT